MIVAKLKYEFCLLIACFDSQLFPRDFESSDSLVLAGKKCWNFCMCSFWTLYELFSVA